jgi:hypothetical protein
VKVTWGRFLCIDSKLSRVRRPSIATATTKDVTEVNYPLPQVRVREYGEVPGWHLTPNAYSSP